MSRSRYEPPAPIARIYEEACKGPRGKESYNHYSNTRRLIRGYVRWLETNGLLEKAVSDRSLWYEYIRQYIAANRGIGASSISYGIKSALKRLDYASGFWRVYPLREVDPMFYRDEALRLHHAHLVKTNREPRVRAFNQAIAKSFLDHLEDQNAYGALIYCEKYEEHEKVFLANYAAEHPYKGSQERAIAALNGLAAVLGLRQYRDFLANHP